MQDLGGQVSFSFAGIGLVVGFNVGYDAYSLNGFDHGHGLAAAGSHVYKRYSCSGDPALAENSAVVMELRCADNDIIAADTSHIRLWR